MGFSENLYHLRSERNMTQEQLAMLMGVSRQAISKWESARAYPEMDKLVRLCDIFSCDLNDLVRGDVTNDSALPGYVVPADAARVDVCGYDRCMRVRALMLASAVAVVLLGLAVFFGTSGTVAYSDVLSGGLAIAPLALLLRNSPVGLPILVACFLVGLALASVSLNRYLGFRGRFPYVEDFYTDEQRELTRALVRRARVIAVITGAVAVVSCLVKAGPLCHLSGGLASLFGWGAVAVWSLVYAKLMDARLDVSGYNERNTTTLEQRAAASAYAELPASRALVRANPEVPRLARVWVKRQTAIAAAAVGLGFALIAGVFALLGWHIWFIPLVVGAVAALLVWFYLPLAR